MRIWVGILVGDAQEGRDAWDLVELTINIGPDGAWVMGSTNSVKASQDIRELI